MAPEPMDIDVVAAPPDGPRVSGNAAPTVSQAPTSTNVAPRVPQVAATSANAPPLVVPRAAATSASKRQVSQCPDEFLCPITSALMRDPVLLVETGHSYERAAIEKWFQEGKATCPLTGVNLRSKQVSPNMTVRKLIQDWAARHPTHSAVRQQTPAPTQPNGTPVPPNGVVPPTVAPPGRLDPTPSPVPPAAGQLFGGLNGFGLPSPRRSLQDPAYPLFGGHEYHVGAASMPPADDDEPANTQALPSGAETAGGDGASAAAAASAAATPTLAVTPEFETVGLPQQETLVLVRASAPASGQRVPIDLVAVLDVSGSMAGSRLQLVKETMMFVISHLQPSDRLSIVTFSDCSRRAIKLTRATDGGKEQMNAAVNGLRIEGGTSILAGLKLGQHVLASRRQSNPVACMFLLSDGQDGSTFGPRLNPSEARRQAGNVPVHTFGYGSDHDDRILDAIAAGSNGTFSYVRDNNEVKEAVAQSLGGALSVALQATTVHLKAARGVAVLSVNAGVYEASVDEGRVSASVALKDMYSGETRDFLVKLQVPAADDRLTPTKLLSGRLEYTLPGREEVNRSPVVTVSVARGERPEGTRSNLDVDLQRNRLSAADAMRTADTLAEDGNLGRARDVISSALTAISQSASAGSPACVGVLEDLRKVARGFASESEYQREGAKMAKCAGRTHASQRAAFSSAPPRQQNDGPRQASISQYATPAAALMSSMSRMPNE